MTPPTSSGPNDSRQSRTNFSTTPRTAATSLQRARPQRPAASEARTTTARNPAPAASPRSTSCAWRRCGTARNSAKRAAATVAAFGAAQNPARTTQTMPLMLVGPRRAFRGRRSRSSSPGSSTREATRAPAADDWPTLHPRRVLLFADGGEGQREIARRLPLRRSGCRTCQRPGDGVPVRERRVPVADQRSGGTAPAAMTQGPAARRAVLPVGEPERRM